MNLASGLVKLGFTPRVDFVVSFADNVETITWMSAQPQPTAQAIAAASTAADQAQATEDARVAAIVASPVRADWLARLRSATPQQISDYVDNQVTGTTAQQLIAVKAILKGILLAIALDARR